MGFVGSTVAFVYFGARGWHDMRLAGVIDDFGKCLFEAGLAFMCGNGECIALKLRWPSN